jgi:putative aldouronate transport system permease protein
MAPTLTIMLIMRIGSILNVGYEKVMLLYRSGCYETADVVSTYVTRLRAQGESGFSIGTAADLFNSLIAMFLVLGANAISRRVSDTALF